MSISANCGVQLLSPLKWTGLPFRRPVIVKYTVFGPPSKKGFGFVTRLGCAAIAAQALAGRATCTGRIASEMEEGASAVFTHGEHG